MKRATAPQDFLNVAAVNCRQQRDVCSQASINEFGWPNFFFRCLDPGLIWGKIGKWHEKQVKQWLVALPMHVVVSSDIISIWVSISMYIMNQLQERQMVNPFVTILLARVCLVMIPPLAVFLLFTGMRPQVRTLRKGRITRFDFQPQSQQVNLKKK